MKVVFATGALDDIVEAQTWWVANRHDAAGLMSEELTAAFDELPEVAESLPRFRRVGLRDIRRHFLPRVHRHIYFHISTDGNVVVLAVWGAVRGLLPRLRKRADP
jgi:hypothetical protein